MATVIGIMGKSGHGKTTSARNLDPSSTLYIDCDKKGLSWRGWKKAFNAENKNYLMESDPQLVWKYLVATSEKHPHIKTIIVDTVNGIMLDDEFKRMREKGYDKWQDIAFSVYCMVRDANKLRQDLTVVFVFHLAEMIDDSGNRFSHILTGGKKLEKIQLETKMTTVLLAKCNDGNYVFETQARNSTAKSPMGLFDTFEIPNDLKVVIDSIKSYEQGE